MLAQILYTAAGFGQELFVGVGYIVIYGVVDVCDGETILLKLFAKKCIFVTISHKLLVETCSHKGLA